MRKVLLLASAVCFAATSVSAFEFNPYVAAKAKYAFARNSIKVTGTFEGKKKINDDVLGGSVAVGTIYNLPKGDLRFEVEYTKNSNTKKENERVKTQAVLFNAYYDFNLNTALPIKPYVGLGLGWGRAILETKAKDFRDNGVSMQFGGGINYQITEKVVADLGYRYMTYGDFEEEYRIPGLLYEKYECKPRAHEILLGVRYEF